MKQLICSLTILLLFSFMLHAIPHRLVSQTVDIDQALGLAKYESVIQVGQNPLNRFTMHRVVRIDHWKRPLSPRALLGPIILLPGGGSNFDSYLVGPGGDSLATFLALKGMDVYGYSPRTRGIEPGYCDNHDCSTMQTWGFASYAEDIEFIRKHATRLHHKRPVVGGLSLGSMLSIVAVNKKPNGYSGAILWEGGLYYAPPVSDLFTDVCTAFQTSWNSGIYYDDEAYPFLKALSLLYQYEPNNPSPFAEGMTNRDFFIYFITTPHEPPNGEAPGYTYAAGDMVNGMIYVDENLLFQFVDQLNHYEPIAVFRDYMCGLAGQRTFTSRLAQFHGPILSMQAGIGFGPYVEDNLSLFVNSPITRYIQPSFGHIDFGVPQDYVHIIAQPIWDWLEDNIIPTWKK